MCSSDLGKNASKYNTECSLDYLNEIASDSGVKLGYTVDSLGIRYNSIVKKSAKADKNGIYSQNDSLANFRDAQMCATFLNGFDTGMRKNNMRRK